VPSPASIPAILATPPRFGAPRAASPRPEPTPHLPELGRAPRRPKSSRSRRPPLSFTELHRPLRRASLSGLSLPKSIPR
jgi:hypothetical protein